MHYVSYLSSACLDTYILTENFRAPGSDVQSGVTELTDCEALCTATNDCNGFDFRTNNKCYLITEAFDSLTANNLYDNYARVRCDTSKSDTENAALYFIEKYREKMAM